ncbi:thiamine biosynthesis lipoprotein [Paucibacter oligotrophus]|uniref:FAD:protein FMN transferase n=1 Tax=Roseateles oligotrophus TaxID=1769250 RepID=A0A840L7V4_9BURK|nr:FAD:protein FMN transferase [Roseateles oligotrophus]MBB4844644.1 thiamine biosynthesis lipoprotein [Roseateles oligotrophus]
MGEVLDRQVFVPAQLQALAPPQPGERVHELAGQSMGTSWCVKFVAPAELRAAVILRGIEAQLQQVVGQMSPWEAAADVQRYAQAPAQSWVPLPQACFSVLSCALAVAEASGGAFDPTAAPLVQAWGFGPAARLDQRPAAQALARLNLGYQRIQLDAARRLAWQPGGLALDFCGVAKGFAVDLVAAYLRACGLPHFLVEIGGELRGEGLRPDGQPWWVALEQPPDLSGNPDCPQGRAVPSPALACEALLALHGLAVATSGDYRNCYWLDGQPLSHTLDPRSRQPIAHGLAAVSVLHESCMWADAWATALMVLGLDAGMALARQQGLAVRFVPRGQAAQLSPALLALLD